MTETTGTEQASAAPPQDEPTNGMEVNDERDTWSGRCTFWLAAVGSAVGLGNLWRFPWQCNKWGAGSFIFAYFVALFTLGMPLLTQELVLGQKHRSGDIEAFGRMNWRLRGIGLASVVGAFGIVTYYMMIIGISMVFFFESFMVPMPWEGSADDGALYWLEMLKVPDSIAESGPDVSWKLLGATVFCWVITFFCIRRGVKTASWAVKITMPLPFILLIILLIQAATLDGAGDGVARYLDFSNWSALSENGIWQAAIGQCFFSLGVCMGVMTAFGSYNPVTQDIATDEKVISFMDVFASIMSGFVVYCILGFLVFDCNANPAEFLDVTWVGAGQFVDPYDNVTWASAGVYLAVGDESNATWAGAAGLCGDGTTLPMRSDGTSFDAVECDVCADDAIDADATMCYVDTEQCEGWYTQGGFALVFSAFPVAISQFAGANVFSVLFFSCLVMLGIDSAFSITEAICTVIFDADVNTYRWKLSKPQISGITCVCGCLGSMLFCFDTGFFWLDIVDYYINNYGMVLLGVLETSACGWFYGYERIEVKLGKECTYIYRAGFWASLLFGSILSFLLSTPVLLADGSYEFTGALGGAAVWPGLIIGFGGWGGTSYYAWTKRIESAKELPMSSQLWLLFGWENVEVLRDFMNTNGLGAEEWLAIRHTTAGELKVGMHHSTIGIWWGFLVKYWIPVILTVVLFSSMKNDCYNPYGGYEWSQLMVGIFIFSSMIVIVVMVAIFPEYMTQKADEKAEDEAKKVEMAGTEGKQLNQVASTSAVVSADEVEMAEEEVLVDEADDAQAPDEAEEEAATEAVEADVPAHVE